MSAQGKAQTLSEGMLDANGVQMFFAEIGAGEPLLLLHGGGPGASGLPTYSKNIEPLSERFRVIVPDLPGYGRSQKGIDRSDPFGCLADATRGLMDALEIERAHMVGNSYGGAAALRLALDTPERIGRMVLMGPGGVGTTRALPTDGLNHLLDYYKGEGPSRKKVATFLREYLVHDGSVITDAMVEERYQASIDPEVIAQPPLTRPSGPLALRTLWRMDFTRDKRLEKLETPTLVLWGTEDKVNRPEGGRMLAERMPDCRLVEVPDTAHWVQWEQADLFNREVSEFLNGGRADD